MENEILEGIKWLLCIFVLCSIPTYFTGLIRAVIHDKQWVSSMLDLFMAVSIVYLYVNGLP